MKLADDLRTHDYSDTVERFREIIVAVHEVLYPLWSDEKLMRNPDEAKAYCDAVRSRTCPGLPDDLILGTLINIRKKHSN